MKKLPKNIKAAIAAGEAEVAKKKAAENVIKAAEAAAEAVRRAGYYKQAEEWAKITLPRQIQEETAKGHRSLRVDEYEAYACRQLGMEIRSYVNHNCGSEELCGDRCVNVYSVGW